MYQLYVFLCMIFISTICEAKLSININYGSVLAAPIAIVDTTSLSQDSDAEILELAKNIYTKIYNNLHHSGLFKVIPQASFLQNKNDLKQAINFSEWRLIKADNLLLMRVDKDANQCIKIEFKLYDTVREIQIAGQSFSGNKQVWSRIAHKISDAIYYRIIGDTGYFDTRILYVSRQELNNNKRIERLAIIDQDGDNHQFITDGSSLVLTPRFSPDMGYIAYLDYVNKDPHVYILDRKNNKKYLVGNFPGMTFAPRFSADGKHMVMSYAIEGNSSLFSMDLNSKKIKRLTFGSVIDTSPCYSPDGKQIVFNSDRSGQPHLYIMNVNGGEAKKISFGKGNYRSPVWSPRGDLIAFIKIYQGEFFIGIMHNDGSNERLITKAFLIESPSWSPDGRFILFTRENNKGYPKLYTIDTTGYNQREIKTPTNAIQGFWSTKCP